MKTQQILASIIKSYNQLSLMAEANIKNVKPNIFPVWSLSYKQYLIDGKVNKFGNITRGKTKIEIRNGKINKVKKPFFSSWTKALKKVDNMLKNMIEKFNSKKNDGESIVKQRQVNILCFSKEALAKMQKHK